MEWRITDLVVPALVAVVGAVLIGAWVSGSDVGVQQLRIPGLDRPDGDAVLSAARQEAPTVGEPTPGTGVPSQVLASWPWFRGPDLNAICPASPPLMSEWPENGPPVLWTISLGEGYAGAAIANGCAYVLDYDEAAQADTLLCLSLDDGQEIWRNGYAVELMRNHGMSRTVPAIVDGRVITIGPRCHVACWDAATGASQWLIDLELEYQTEVPRWYAGQCPLIDNGRLILAPGGKALVMAVDLETGEPIWQTPNPHRWRMTHVSVVPMQCGDQRTYVYCGTDGVVGVSADDGTILWESPDWVEVFATAPSPVILPDNKLFFSSGYDSKVGSLVLQVNADPPAMSGELLFTLAPRQFNSEQQTPILYDNHLIGVRKYGGGRLVCLELDGTEVWDSGRDRFGHGPYMIADGKILAMSNNGQLVMAEANTKEYRRLASFQVFEDGHDAWGPMALADGRLIVREMTRMTCLDLAAPGP